MSTILCGNASDSLYLTFKGGCRKELTHEECYRCTGCGGRFHKECALEHFKLEASHDWGRQQEREQLLGEIYDTFCSKIPSLDEIAKYDGHLRGKFDQLIELKEWITEQLAQPKADKETN